MKKKNNPYTNLKVEFHILQSFPVTCLNRDDVGAPKTAIVGGVTRARVSSQCWKRQVRLALRDFGIKTGKRTKLISKLIRDACMEKGAKQEEAEKCGHKVAQIFIKKAESKKGKDNSEEDDESVASDKTDTLLFLSKREIEILAEKFKEAKFSPEAVITQAKADKQAKEIEKLIGKPEYSTDGLDIALFGRMVAQAAKMNVEAASSFAHAISTHRVSNEVEFFTALDDVQEEEPGSAHMGSLEFNSATYYRYVSLDIGQLYETLVDGEFIPQAIESFIKALYVAVPSARQTTQSGASPWEFAKVLVRKGQRLQVPFEKPVAMGKGGGFLETSIEELKNYLAKKEKEAGSLFSKIAEFDFGEDEKLNVDKLIKSIQNAVAVKN